MRSASSVRFRNIRTFGRPGALRKREMTAAPFFRQQAGRGHEKARHKGRAKVDAAGRRQCAARSVSTDYWFSE